MASSPPDDNSFLPAGWSWSDVGHGALDGLGVLPIVGEAADLANAAWLASEGNYLDAGLSVVSMIPVVGDVVGKGGKFAKKMGGKLAGPALDMLKTIDFRKALDGLRSNPKLGPHVDKMIEALDKWRKDTLGVDPPGSVATPAKLDATPCGTLPCGKTISTGAVGQNKVTWTADAEGRPVRAEATLKEVHSGGARSSAEKTAQRNVGASGQAGDQGGHIIGHRFMPDQGSANMFPQAANFNNSAWKKMENEWADWIEAGAEVRVQIDLGNHTGARPDDVLAIYEVFDKNGKLIYTGGELFSNAAGQTFDRQSRSAIQSMFKN